MYVADCLYMGSEVSIIAKSELVLKTLISSVDDERGNGDIDVLDIVTDKDFQPVVHAKVTDYYCCSNCQHPFDFENMFEINYCPNCGAKLK